MALLFAESWDALATGVPSINGWANIGSGGGSVNATAGRWGTQGMLTTDVRFGLQRPISSLPATAFFGFAMSVGSFTNAQAFFGVLETATSQVNLQMLSTGAIRAARGGPAGTTLGDSAAGVLVAGTYHYIEVKVIIHNTTGAVVVKVDGTTVINLTGINTRQTANAWLDAVQYGGFNQGNTSPSPKFDDIYICDSTGSSPTNDFLGDVRVEALLPNGDGNSSVLVGSDGNSVNNSLLVDEVGPNGDTDYVSSATPGDKDTYAYANLTSTTGTVYGVIVQPYARKDDAGARSIVSVARLSGTEVDGPVQTLASSYAYLPDVREAKPGGGVWTISDVNSAEFGVKVNA